MQAPVTIKTNSPVHPSLDYHFLRKEGIKHFQRLAGHLWTDHNMHDPGITIWENLCYALTDLAYRMQMQLEDILAYKSQDSFQDFFRAAEILSTAPVSLKDYRKIIIDVPGVRNAWMVPTNNKTPLYYDPTQKVIITQRNKPDSSSNLEEIQLKGLYRVLIAGDGSGVEAEVAKRLHENRSLGMDFTDIVLMPKENIGLDIDIEIDNIEDGIQLLGEIYFQIDAYISPRISFYSLYELLEEGMRYEEIFNGPRLNHGFIKDNELDQLQRKSELRASDIIQAIMDVKGVAVVRNLMMISGSKKDKWVLGLSENYSPEFQPLNSNIRFFKGGLEIKVDQKKAITYATLKKQRFANRAFKEGGYDRLVSGGKQRELESYESIQNHFPENYGIGDRGLPATASPQRKGQVKQLKAYLIFFEQILANLISQNAHSAKLFSFNTESNQSYYAQSLIGSVPGLENILVDPVLYEDKLLKPNESELSGIDRKKKFLNHILARFGEQFTEYSLVLFGAVSGNVEEGNEHTEQSITTMELNARKTFLKEYPALSSRRHLGINYIAKGLSWNTHRISGVKRRIARLMGLTQIERSDIAYVGSEFSILPVSQPPSPNTYSWTFSHENMSIKANEVFPNEEMARISIQQFIVLAAEPDQYSITPAGQRLKLEDKNGNIIAQRDNLPGLAEAEALKQSLISYFTNTYPAKSPENFHLVEHILLRPVLGQVIPRFTQRLLEKVPRKDPYSLQLSFLLPLWAGRFQNESFRTFTEQLIRQESPAYLSIFIHWMNWEQMAAFEDGYKQWLQKLASG